MKYRIYLMIATIMWTSSITAQGLGESQLLQKQQQGNHPEQNDKGNAPLVSNRDQTGVNSYAAGSILQASSDKSVAYYQNVAKQWGWYVGIGPALTKEEASHLNVVYKFSNKNKAGHWMKLEAIDGYGDYTTDHRLETYIAPSNGNDSTINVNWKEKITSVCQWEFMPDGSGNSVIMERAYDDEKNLIYNYQPVFISDKEIIGSYTDSWGLPAKISQKNGKPADVLVNIQLDQWGNDSIIKLVDTEGNLLMNSSGSWIIRNICDRHGNVLENYALNQLGAPMNDNWGNCSWKAIMDNYGNTLHNANFDAGGNPVRLSGDYTCEDVSEKHYEYDRWHRLVSKSFYNGNEPDTTSQGVHKIDYTYNNYGQKLSMIARGLNNEPRAYGKAKSAYDYYQYDPKGNILSLLRLGPDSFYLKSDDYYYRVLIEYDGDNLKKEEDYIYNGSDTVLWHYESYSPPFNIFYHRNESAYIDSLDANGNILSRTYVTKDQDPITLPDRLPGDYNPYSRYVSTYQYAPHLCTKVTTWYDQKGNWAHSNSNDESPARTIVTTDSLRHTITHTEFSKDSVILAHYQEVYDEHFSMLQYKQSLTTTGEAGRSGLNDALYYKTKMEYTPTGQVSSITSLNEFDEPTYACSNYYYYCYQINDNSGKPVYYDENKNVVKRYGSPSGTKAASVEIISESGKNNGLKDGDILIRYGEWLYSHNQNSYYGFKDLYAQMVFSAIKDSIEIWILRHFTEEKESKIIKLHVKGGTISEIGFAVHEIYYTNKETQRYLRAFLDFKQEEELAGRSVMPIKKQGKNNYYAQIIPHYSNRIYSAYSHGWHNPMFLIAKKQDGSSGWPESNNDHVYSYDGEREYTSIFDECIYLMSEDGISLKCDSLDGHLSNVDINNNSLSEEEHQKAIKLLEKAKDKYPDVFIPNKNEYMSEILRSQPSDINAINAYEMIKTIKKEYVGFSEKDKSPQILNHLEDIDSTEVLRVYSNLGPEAKKYRELTYLLDKKYYTSQIAPKDTNQIAEKGIAFLHETPAGIDEILYLSQDTVVWAKGNMTHGTKDIIKKNMLGGEYSPLDKYNQNDLNLNNLSKSYDIAILWHNHQLYSKSLPLLKRLCKRKYGPAYATLAKAYLTGTGVAVDTIRAISLYEKAHNLGEPVHNELGKLYYEIHQYKSALQHLKYGDNAQTYYVIGTIYENGGHGVTANSDSAYYYYSEASKSYDDSDWEKFFLAEERISHTMENRKYMPSDFVELSPLIARSMSVDSLYSIGRKYYFNDDYVKAYPYLKAAADSLYPEAEVKIARYMEDERFGFNDKQKAQEFRQLAKKHYLEYAEKGNKVAYSMIAKLYKAKDMEGKGIDLDSTKYYYELALQHYDFSVAKTLGDIYKEEYNYSEALNAYLIGAKAGQKDCMYLTAQLYELDFNIPEATKWYRECYQTSENQGERERAKNALERLGASLVQKLTASDMVGVWLQKNANGEKVFLPNGYFFGFFANDTRNVLLELKNQSFTPWMIGKYHVYTNSQYEEEVELLYKSPDWSGRKNKLSVKFYGNTMTTTYGNNTLNTLQTWIKQSNDSEVINYIMQNWESYKKYLQDNLQYSK